MVAMCLTRASNAACISLATAHEAWAGWGMFSSSVQSCVAFLTTAGSVEGSSDLKPGGTLELLMRFASGSRHLAVYDSPRKSSNERIAGSGLSARSAYRRSEERRVGKEWRE